MYLRNMSNAELRSFCEEHDVCQEGLDWLKDRDLKRALADCPRPDWIEWFIGKLDTHAGNTDLDKLNQYFDETETAYRQYAAAERRARKGRNELLEDVSNGYSAKANTIFDEHAPAINAAHSLKDRDTAIARRTRALDAAYHELESGQQKAQAAYTSMMLPAKLKFLAALKASIVVYEVEGEYDNQSNTLSG